MNTLSAIVRAGYKAGIAIVIGVTLIVPISANAEDKIKCVFPFWFGFAPVFVAQEQGYFEQQGLHVTTAFDNDRANVLPAMATGAVDCTMRTIGEAMSRPRKADTTGTVIGTIDISVGADGVVASPEIKTVSDLVGKVFAGEINHPGTVLVQHALAKEGKSIKDVEMKLIATDDSAAVFEDESIAAVATWEPMMSSIVKGTSRKGAHILISSADYEGLITDIVLVRTEDYKKNPKKYAKFLRGIYRAVDLYRADPDKFIAISAPKFDVSAAEMKEALQGVKYTSYEESVAYLPSTVGEGKLKEVFDAFNEINVSLDLQDAPFSYKPFVDGSLMRGLFDGHQR